MKKKNHWGTYPNRPFGKSRKQTKDLSASTNQVGYTPSAKKNQNVREKLKPTPGRGALKFIMAARHD